MKEQVEDQKFPENWPDVALPTLQDAMAVIREGEKELRRARYADKLKRRQLQWNERSYTVPLI